MTLASITRQANAKPLRVLLHGVEKVGKTTFGAGAPAPIFLCPEDGIPRALGEVPHYPTPDGGWTWLDVLDAVRALTGDHNYQTLILDTVDWLEPLLWRHVCAHAGVSSIEEVGGGYGKGYTAALDGWRSLLADLERLRAGGMHIIMLAHSWIRPFKDPLGEGYDRYELKVNNKAAGLLKEWSDALLFAQHEDLSVKDKRSQRVRGVSTGERVIYTVHHAGYDAGNRFGLPEQLPLDWPAFFAAVEGVGAPPAVEEEQPPEEVPTEEQPTGDLRLAIEQKLVGLPPASADKARDALDRSGDDLAKLARVGGWVTAQFAKGGV